MAVQNLMAKRRLDHILNQVGKYPQTAMLFMVICALLMSVDAMLLRCIVPLLLHKYTQVDGIVENGRQWYGGGNKLNAAYSNISHLHSAHEC